MQKVAVVTGASSGIGYATARALYDTGHLVYGLSRRGTGPEGVFPICCDLTDGAAVEAAFSQIAGEAGRIDILVNNAGSGISGAVEFARPEDIRAQMDINLSTAVRCIQAALPALRESRGRIVNISSAASVFPIPFQALYSASKSALNTLSLALYNELRPFGVGVSALLLGDVRTGFTGARKKGHAGDELYGGRISASVAVMERDEAGGTPPEEIARRITRLLARRRMRPLYVIGGQYRLFVLLGRLLPTGLMLLIVRKLYRSD